MANLNLEKVPVFYHNYISKVPENNLAEAMERHTQDLLSFLQTIPDSKWDFRYAEGKWSIREVVQHLIDSERIFCYRALTFARQDPHELPGFDEDRYAAVCNAARRSADELLEELAVVQRASQLLFASFDASQLAAGGIANKKPIYVEALGFIIVGHSRHHQQVIRERYL